MTTSSVRPLRWPCKNRAKSLFDARAGDQAAQGGEAGVGDERTGDRGLAGVDERPVAVVADDTRIDGNAEHVACGTGPFRLVDVVLANLERAAGPEAER